MLNMKGISCNTFAHTEDGVKRICVQDAFHDGPCKDVLGFFMTRWAKGPVLGVPGPGVRIAVPLTEEQAVLYEISGIYNDLSPENLHCDGEISLSAARAKAKKLNARLAKLQKKLKAPVDEMEVYRLLEALG